MGRSKMAPAWIIVVVGAVLTSSAMSAGEGDKGECMEKCIHDCIDKRGGMCAFNCALECKWPFAQPTGEVLVSTAANKEAPAPDEDEAIKAAFEVHQKHDEAQTPKPATP